MKKDETDDFWSSRDGRALLGVFAGLIVILIGILVGKILGVMERREVFIAVGIFVAIVVGINFLVVLVLRGSHGRNIETLRISHRQEIDDVIERLKAVIPPMGFEWLFNDAELASIEGNVKGKDIWIVSPDFYYDLIKGNFQTLTKKNFQKGIKYTYIVPKSEPMQALIPVLKRDYSEFLDQVKIRQVPEETFRVLAVTHIDIYDPYRSHKDGTRVFLELPVKQRGYWVEVSQEAALGLIGRFRPIVEDESLT